MKLTKKCRFNNTEYTMELPISEDVYNKCMLKRELKGLPIQDAFPMLNAAEREFILTGTPPYIWEEIFKGGGNV